MPIGNQTFQVCHARFSDEDDCALEQSGCEPGVPQAECNSRIWSPIMVHELPERQADGLKTVYACFIDPAGNTSPAISASIVLDRGHLKSPPSRW